MKMNLKTKREYLKTVEINKKILLYFRLYTSLCSSSDSINIQIDNEEIQRNIKELTEKLILEKSYSSSKLF